MALLFRLILLRKRLPSVVLGRPILGISILGEEKDIEVFTVSNLAFVLLATLALKYSISKSDQSKMLFTFSRDDVPALADAAITGIECARPRKAGAGDMTGLDMRVTLGLGWFMRER